MNLRLGNTALESFKDFIGLLKTTLEEVQLRFNDEGIHVLSMDPSHVAMLDVKVKKALFDVFEAEEETITISVAEFDKFLDRLEKKEQVTISHDAEKGQLVILGRQGGRNRRFTLPLLEPYEEEVPEPKIFFKSKVRLVTAAVDRAIKDAMLVSQSVKIELNTEHAVFGATGDIGSANNEWSKDSDDLLELTSEEESIANFTLSYLNDVMGSLKNMTEVLTLNLSTDMPLKMEATAKSEHIEVIFYLAPMIGV